jgi:hypothetical protein
VCPTTNSAVTTTLASGVIAAIAFAQWKANEGRRRAWNSLNDFVPVEKQPRRRGANAEAVERQARRLRRNRWQDAPI